MARSNIWHGTQQEARELLGAIVRNCTCADLRGAGRTTCAAHDLLRGPQRVLDGLLFARRVVQRLEREEWLASRPSGGQERTPLSPG
jgi:hypothetical protein